MAWSMPSSSGQWNPSMGLNAMMPDMSNMGSYTPEQWAAMQQQNWQQWAQWQQQYAQWHNQYGEKYAEQMHSMQSMSGLPPLPPASSAPPPAPPPPDKPPPPPPHENNQPLYGLANSQPSPVPPPSNNQPWNTNQGNYNKIIPTLGNNANQANFANTLSAPGNNANQGNFSNTMSATGKNVNHGNYSNTKSTPGNNKNWSYTPEAPVEKPQPSVNADALKKLAEEERLFDIQFQKWEEEIDKWRQENVNHPDKQAYKQYEQKFESCRAQLLERRQQMKQKRARLLSNASPAPNAEVQGNITTPVPPPPMKNININRYNPNVQTQNYSNSPSQNYKDHNRSQYQEYNQGIQSGYNRSHKNVDTPPQDRYESYQNIDDNNYEENTYENDNYENNDYSANDANSSFLPTSASSKGIPGLDLVPETDKGSAIKMQDVIDITDDPSFNQQSSVAPDYTTISKGINNILGDEKIMNILSMVRGNNNQAPGNNQVANTPSGAYPTGGNNFPPFNQGERNQNNFNNQQQYNNTVGNRQSQNMTFNRQAQNFSAQLNHGGPPKFPPPQRNMYNEQPDNMIQDQFHDNKAQYEDMPMHENRQFRPIPAPLRQNIPPLMGQIQNIPGQQNINEPPRDLIEKRPLPLNPPVNQNLPTKWVEDPLFTPSIIVEYEHKALRLKARDFIEPVHMFDYNHISKDGEVKKKDFEIEVDDFFTRKPRRFEKDDEHANVPRYSRDQYSRDFERRMPRVDVRDEYRPREELRDEYRPMVPPRDDYDDRRRPSDRYDDRRRDDRDKYSRREDSYRERDKERDRDRDRDRERERESYRDRNRDHRRDDIRNRSRSRDKDTRKRGRSKDSEISNNSTKKSKDTDTNQTPSSERPKHVVMIDDLLEPPGREMRPEKIVIILRGLPGSGKSYLAKLIRDREAEHGGTARIMSIDDYFMQEGEIEEKDPVSGKMIKKPTLKYEYDEKLEETYMASLKRAFKRSLTDGYFTFLIYDAVNDQLKNYADVWNFARQNGFQVYICTLELDAQACYKRNIHNRTLDDIQVLCARFFPTPAHHIQVDPTTLLQSAAIPDVHMEDVDNDVIIEDVQEPEVQSIFTSKWEKMDDAAQLARLDGISKPLRPSQLSMEDYLQIDEWKPNAAKPGKKSVRWADIEETRQQEKMRAIGFVVGQTDWNRMTDPTMGSSALTQTKYIERVRRN